MINYREDKIMDSQEINKLKQVDQIMFNLANSTDSEHDLSKAVELLKHLNLTKNLLTKQELIDAYVQNISQKMPLNVIVHFNMNTLNHYVTSNDDLENSLATDCQKDFKKYALIVLRFDNQIACWQNEKSGADYRAEVQQLDQMRTNIHNACLNDIKIINRMAANDNLPAFADTDNRALTRTDIGQAIVKLECDTTISFIAKLDD